MAQNLIGMLDTFLTDNLMGEVAELLGENQSGVTDAVSNVLPTRLLGLLKKGSEPGGTENLVKILREGKHDGSLLDDLSGMSAEGGAATKLQSTGKVLLGSILGDKVVGTGDLIASVNGISKQSGDSLLGMPASIVMGFLGIFLLWRSSGKESAVQETIQDPTKSVQEAVLATTKKVEARISNVMAALIKLGIGAKTPSGRRVRPGASGR